jgi:hypothetical protein
MSGGGRKRIAIAAAAALAVAACAAPVANGAKVSETAAGGPIPNATGGGGLALVPGVLTQTYELKGAKVKRKRIRDVNLTVTTIGNAELAASELSFRLVAPSGENVFMNIGSAQSAVAVTFDDQSPYLQFCNPFLIQASYCNYLTNVSSFGDGAGIAGGTIASTRLNERFRGLNPKGTWTLRVREFGPNAVTSTLGASVLEVTTGKRFAKEER